MFVLDTNVLSEARKSSGNARVKAWLAARPAADTYICAITVLEIERGIEKLARRGDRAQASMLTHWLEAQVLPAFAGRILAIDHDVARRAARLPWPDPDDYRDALIAASALVLGAAVATRNLRHFASSGVKLVNPWEKDHGG